MIKKHLSKISRLMLYRKPSKSLIVGISTISNELKKIVTMTLGTVHSPISLIFVEDNVSCITRQLIYFAVNFIQIYELSKVKFLFRVNLQVEN